MNCYKHEDCHDIAVCAICGTGLCKVCENETTYRKNKRALCKKCNYNYGVEIEENYKLQSGKKTAVIIINAVFIIIGLVIFIINKFDLTGAIIMLACWCFGSYISSFFDNTVTTKNNKNSESIFSGPIQIIIAKVIGSLLGLILKLIIRAIFAPVLIIANFLGKIKIDRLIADNKIILEKIKV